MLIPLRQGEIDKLVPAVATGKQFQSSLGNPRKILQRIMISSIGGVITLLISQSQVTSQFYSIWLIIGVSFLLYILWGPILEASRKNSKLRKFKYSAILQGNIFEIYKQEKVITSHEQANNLGKLELVENRRTILTIELEDEDGYIGKISFPFENKHQVIKNNANIYALVFSNNRDFSTINAISDVWIPRPNLWVGDYPFLLRPAFEELCSLRYR